MSEIEDLAARAGLSVHDYRRELGVGYDFIKAVVSVKSITLEQAEQLVEAFVERRESGR